ncbi:790_t:CDS:2 [Dentiscutata heterogama]|uniref:790_t:CDS:1 n=1 Tax=Dentiscutata heterogama TaxID=1316150 RepID=A0ACA9LL55_9GLOM|nr:790_t:CDS:2 [Dentiscutata heterogama]
MFVSSESINENISNIEDEIFLSEDEGSSNESSDETDTRRPAAHKYQINKQKKQPSNDKAVTLSQKICDDRIM